MAGNIKGITIEFRGDTTKLDSALRTINNETRKLDKEIRAVDKALKFNPTSVELWRQKQQLLTQKVNETKEKLATLKQAQADMDARGVDKNSEEYRKLQREIIETESKVKTFEGQLRKIGQVNIRAASEQFKQWGASLESAGQKMRGLSTAAAAVAASIGALTVKSAKWADDINTMSKRYSISTTDLQKYSAAADLVDVSTEAIAKSQTKLKKNMLGAMDGTNDQAQYFEQLGVNITNADGSLRDANDVFDDTIAALGQMENETERDAIAMALMGKSANELNPLIEDGGETYKRVADTLKKYNLDFISEEELKNANQFNDELDTIKTIGLVAFQNIGTQLAATLAPALEKVVGWVGKFASWLGNLDPKVLTFIAGIAAVVAAIAPVLIALGKLSTGIGAVLKIVAVVGPAIAALGPMILVIVGVIAAVIVAFKVWQKHGDKIKKFFVAFGKKIVEAWNSLKEGVAAAIESVKAAVQKGFEAIKRVITTVVNAIKLVIKTGFNIIKTIITTYVNAYKLVITTAWNLIKAAVTAVVTGMKIVITTVFNAIKTIITTAVTAYVTMVRTQFNIMKTVVTTVVNAIRSIVTSVFNSLKGRVSSAWNAIKSAIVNPINAAKNAVSNVVNAIRSKVSGAFSGISSRVRSAFNAVKEAITSPIQKAWDLVQSAISKIKGLFPIRLGKIFSGIKLPHFSISGGTAPWGIGGKGTKPSISIDWYKKAMNSPYMFSSPTLFGAGEAGDEILYGRNSLMKDIASAVAAANGGGIVININGANADPREIAEEVKRVLIQETNRRRLAWQ